MATLDLKRIPATLSDGTAYDISYWHIDSGSPGPCVLVTAAIHGNEVNGAEAIRRFMPCAKEHLVKGSCLLVPFANPQAVSGCRPHIDFEFGKSYARDQANNANCTWPGNAEGSSGQRLTAALRKTVVGAADILIDIHSWQRAKGAIAFARTGLQSSIDLVNAFGIPFARHGMWAPDRTDRPVTPCTLGNWFYDTGRTGSAIELSGQYRVFNDQAELGARLLKNGFRHLGLIPGEIEPPERPTLWLNDCEQVEITAPIAGLCTLVEKESGDEVAAGEPLAGIFNDASLETAELNAPCAGRLFQFGFMHDPDWQHTLPSRHPYVKAGETVAVIVKE